MYQSLGNSKENIDKQKQVQAAPLSEIFEVRNILEFRIWVFFFYRSNALHLRRIQDQYTSSMWENTP